MAIPLMPKATAVWLVENTSLTFGQIARFCGMHDLEVQAIADEEQESKVKGLNPLTAGQLTKEELEKAPQDPHYYMELAEMKVKIKVKKKARYIPLSKRQDKPNAIAWLLKNCPELSDAQMMRLLGTTKTTIGNIRDKTHKAMDEIKPQSPVTLGLCTKAMLLAELPKDKREDFSVED